MMNPKIKDNTTKKMTLEQRDVIEFFATWIISSILFGVWHESLAAGLWWLFAIWMIGSSVSILLAVDRNIKGSKDESRIHRN